VYRVAAAKGQVRRVDGKTLEALCRALGVGLGELLEYVPTPEKKKKGVSPVDDVLIFPETAPTTERRRDVIG